MSKAWRRQVFAAARWNQGRDLAGPVFRELSDVEVMCESVEYLWG